MIVMETHVVIMAGGIGSRLLPVSTPGMPKQFIDLLGIGKTMIQLTVDRFRPVCDLKNFWVVTSADYVGIVKEQLPKDVPKAAEKQKTTPEEETVCALDFRVYVTKTQMAELKQFLLNSGIRFEPVPKH